MSGTQEPQKNQNSAPVANQNTGKPRKKNLTQERLKEVLYYDPNTGIFTRLISITNCVNVGDVAGTHNNENYIQIYVDGESYQSHRLAWLYVYGYFPENDIDHINRVRSDNRLFNLREVSRQCNLRNSPLARNNTSGVTGVSWRESKQRWKADITINYKTKHIGTYTCFIEAVAHRYAAEQCLNWSTCSNKTTAAEHMEKYVWRKTK